MQVKQKTPLSESFGGYALLEQIGVGGMAEVFLAQRSGLAGFEKDIVIKRIRPHLTSQENFVQMFLGEAKLAAQLSHPNVIQIYDLGKIDSSYFIAMEYIAGRDMSALIPKCKAKGIPFPVEYALKICSNVLEGLAYAHDKSDTQGKPLRIVHRDISPENIRIAWTGAVKILDFGIAKAETQLHETRVGEIKGKLSYMSPEQVKGDDIDGRSDLFAMGVVLYECITGYKPFSGENDLELMNSIVDGTVYPPSYFRDDIPEEIERIILKALAVEVEARYQKAVDMQYDIDSFLASHEFTPSNTHLANFTKQLFEKEIKAEQKRRAQVKKKQSQHQSPQTMAEEHTPKIEIPNLLDSTQSLPLALADESTETNLPPQELAPSITDDFLELNSQDLEINTLTDAGSSSPSLASQLPTQRPTIQDPLELKREGVLVHFTPEKLQQLQALASKHGSSAEEIIRDMVENFLKFQT